MMVARRHFDAGAALCCGFGVSLIAIGVKPTPSPITILDAFAPIWAVLLTLGCLGACLGALLRTHRPDRPGQKAWSIRLELICWPAIAWSATIFAAGVMASSGIIAGATTIGWTGFVVFTATGHWYTVRKALKNGTWKL